MNMEASTINTITANTTPRPVHISVLDVAARTVGAEWVNRERVTGYSFTQKTVFSNNPLRGTIAF